MLKWEVLNMEQQVCINCERRERRCCVDLIIFILSVLLAFAIGLLIGALTGIVELLGIGPLITFIVILILLIVLRVIMRICCPKSC